MKRFFLVSLLVACGASAAPLAVREYDAGAFVLSYKAPARVDPVFTHISLSFADRADGAVYVTAEPPGGVFGAKPGRSFSIFVLPAHRFETSGPDLSQLADSLPSKLKANHPSEVFSARVREIASRRWCELSSVDATSAEAVTGVAYYSYADASHLLYVGWTFPRPISKARFAEGERARFEILSSFVVALKRPNQSPEPTAMSVTPPAAQEPRQP